MAGKKGRDPGRRALQIVRKFAPGVTKVVDAAANTTIEVTKANTESKAVKNHQECALAVACKQKMKLDDVIISRSMAYLIRGKTAVRYKLPENVSREIVAFDRGGKFAAGEYDLKKPQPTNLLESDYHSVGGNVRNLKGSERGHAHRVTANIRANLQTRRAQSDAD